METAPTIRMPKVAQKVEVVDDILDERHVSIREVIKSPQSSGKGK